MRRVSTVTLVLLVAVLGTLAGVAVEPARASHGPLPDVSTLTTAQKDALRNILAGREGTTGRAYWDDVIQRAVRPTGTLTGTDVTNLSRAQRLTAAARASRFLPTAGVMALRLTTVGTLAYGSWLIYREFSDSGTDEWFQRYSYQDFYYEQNPDAKQFTACAFPQTGTISGTANSVHYAGACPDGVARYVYPLRYGIGMQWQRVDSAWTGEPTSHPSRPYFIATIKWNQIKDGAYDGNFTPLEQGTYSKPDAHLINPIGYTPGGGSGSAGIGYDQMCASAFCDYIHHWRDWHAAQMGWAQLGADGITDAATVGTLYDKPTTIQGATWKYRIATGDELGELIAPIGPAPAPSTTPDVTTEYEVPSDAGNDSDLQEAVDIINDHPDLSHEIAEEIELQTDEETATFVLPRPGVNETYADYIDRLEALGWIGTATTTVLNPADEGVGPEGVSRIQIGPRVLATNAWPTTSVLVALDAPIDLYYNPTSAPPVSDPTGSGAGGGGGGGCDPWVSTSLDMTPLTEVDLGDKFPFGIFTWVGTFLGQFDVTSDAPSWTFPMDIPSTGVSPEYELGDFTIDLEWADSYMATIRTLIAFALWVGAIWFLATSLLGFRAAGDPAEATDEAF